MKARELNQDVAGQHEVYLSDDRTWRRIDAVDVRVNMVHVDTPGMNLLFHPDEDIRIRPQLARPS